MKTFVKLSLALLLSTTGAAFAVNLGGVSANTQYDAGTNTFSAGIRAELPFNFPAGVLNADWTSHVTNAAEKIAPNKYEIALFLGGQDLSNLTDKAANAIPVDLPAPVNAVVSKSDLVRTAAVILAEGAHFNKAKGWAHVSRHAAVGLVVDKVAGYVHGKAVEYANKLGLDKVANLDAVKNRPYLAQIANYVAYKTVRYGVHAAAKHVNLVVE